MPANAGKGQLASCSEKFNKAMQGSTRRVIICAGTGCVANGSFDVFHDLENKIKTAGIDVKVLLDYEDGNPPGGKDFLRLSKSGCQGFCQQGPLLVVQPDGILYTNVKVSDVDEIVEKTIVNKEVVERLLYVDRRNGDKRCRGQQEIPFYQQQTRIVLERCGQFDPEDIYEYIAHQGYEAAEKAWTKSSADEVCAEVDASGLRGRGGGGFPTGKKWLFAAKVQSEVKYVICNADEGDPGAFMDRSVMEGNPHSVVEGMIIAARGIGATEGYVYVRHEYQLAVERVKKAVKDAEALGILGNNVFGTGKSFKIYIREGAGAFVCGEETALIASIEGSRGTPKLKPPFPAISGLWGKPTIINNVETLASIPYILLKGAENYRKVGTQGSPGTKTFALTGHVVNTGLIEVPFGSTLRQIIFEIGGGVIDSKGNIANDAFKAVQIGGPSGGCLIKEHLDLPLDFDSLKTVGAMVGSGGLVVMNEDNCMVDVAKFFMDFIQRESCGKCVPCREGTRRMLETLQKITHGRRGETGKQALERFQSILYLENLAEIIRDTSLCGLGQTAPNPVLATLRWFRHEYEAHVYDRKCPAKACTDLIRYEITDKCTGCTLCAKKCPVQAITGTVKTKHSIGKDTCIGCGACADNCRFHAIIKV